MNEQDKQFFENMIVKAVQSGKRETNGLVTEIMQKIDENLETSVEKLINGKLRKVLESQKGMSDKIDEYIKDDSARWNEYEPYIKGIADISGAGKIVVWLSIGLSAIIGAILTVRHLFK